MSRLQESLKELSNFKTRVRAKNELDLISAQGNSASLKPDSELSRLKELLAERSEQVARLAADNEVLTRNNKKIIDGMLRNELSYSGKMVSHLSAF